MFIKRSSLSPENLLKNKNASEKGVAEGAENTLSPEDQHQEKIEKKAAILKQQDEREKLELLEYYKFPTIMGWYFDGTFTSNFTLHDEYAEYFNEIEDELEAQKDLIIEETFTELAYRNFWPPKYYGGKYFRTRGVYLDFKEVKADLPKTPPNINFEKQRGIIGVEIEGDPGEIQESGGGISLYNANYGMSGTNSIRDRWYWNEGKREFKPKDVDGDYHWCEDERIWREADPTYRTPYDWYFDEHEGRYLIRNRATPDEYEFDQDKNIYRKIDSKGPSVNGLRNNDYFYDEKQRKWLPITSPTGNITVYNAGSREIVIDVRGKSGLIPDDFYYDGQTGKMEEKDVNGLQDYFYDTKDKMFKKKGQPYGPGKANHFPLDYEFDHNLGKFHPKPAKECRHIEPYDWYFDVSTGKFNRIDGANRANYVFDSGTNVYKLKGAVGPSANGLSIEDYYWSEVERQWKLTVTLKDPSVLEWHEPGKRKVLKGDRGKADKVSDDYYYDAYDGSFFRKDNRKLDNYWFDSSDGVWKKKGQPYGPGVYQLYPENYYFDYDEGTWMPTNSTKLIIAMRIRGEVKGLSDYIPYDFAFHDNEGELYLRDKKNPRLYTYNPQTGVFHKEGLKPPTTGIIKNPKDYFFDEYTASWLPLVHPKGHEARDYKYGRRNNRPGPRGKSGKIPDDFYFSYDSGTFMAKEKDDPSTKYDYMPDSGVWRSTNGAGPSLTGPTPRDYYFDKEEGIFRLKKDLEYGEISLNPNTNLWMQKWRRPQDYYWDPRQNKYLRKPASLIEKEKLKQAAGKGGAGGAGGAGPTQDALMQAEAAMQKDKDDRRDYERPWLHHYVHLAADEVRFEQELTKQGKKEDKTGKNKKNTKQQQGDNPPVVEAKVEQAPAEVKEEKSNISISETLESENIETSSSRKSKKSTKQKQTVVIHPGM